MKPFKLTSKTFLITCLALILLQGCSKDKISEISPAGYAKKSTTISRDSSITTLPTIKRNFATIEELNNYVKNIKVIKGEAVVSTRKTDPISSSGGMSALEFDQGAYNGDIQEGYNEWHFYFPSLHHQGFPTDLLSYGYYYPQGNSNFTDILVFGSELLPGATATVTNGTTYFTQSGNNDWVIQSGHTFTEELVLGGVVFIRNTWLAHVEVKPNPDAKHSLRADVTFTITNY